MNRLIRNCTFVAVAWLLSAGATHAVGPPIRSTHYDGSARVSFSHRPEFDATVPMTIEAWVYRFDEERCETIISHDYQKSWWFGFCPKLRFYRSGFQAATSHFTAQAHEWTHVAASYDGARVKFYINGTLADDLPLANDGAGDVNALWLGASPSFSGSYGLHGYLDEVRLWSVARTRQEIIADMNREVRSGDGLVAAFGSGGRTEDVLGLTGTVNGAATDQVVGVLPRDLVIPKAALTPTIDGRVNLDTEYLGAEQLVVRFHGGSNQYWDGVAHLVYTDTGSENLYIGINNPRRTDGGWPYASTYLSVFVDPDFSRDDRPQTDDFQMRTTLAFDPDVATWWWGTGFPSWEQCPSIQPCPPSSHFEVGKLICGDDVNPPPPCTEFRISKAQLGEWTEYDGLAFGQFDVNAFGFDYMAPLGASPTSPATWAKVSYGDGTAALPIANISGRIFAGLNTNSPGLPNHQVRLLAGGALHTTTTAADGTFSFSSPVPPDATIRILPSNCGFCEYAGPQFTGGGIPGTVIDELEVNYPPCTGSQCNYQGVNFFILQPLDAITFTGADPDRPEARLIVRDNPQKVVPADGETITIFGTNFHSLMEVYLAPHTISDDPNDFVLYQAELLEIAPDRMSAKVKVPILPAKTRVSQGGPIWHTLAKDWRWVIHDPWVRLSYRRWNIFPDPNGPGPESFFLRQPEYPILWGFGIDNQKDSAGLDDFLGTYQHSAYKCVGALGFCLTHVPDPLYWTVWFPIYKIWVDKSSGNCVGMASTSLLMRRGVLDAEDYTPSAYFPAGFDDPAQPARWNYPGCTILCGPPTPKNIWAEIRKNHGFQTSAEFLGHAISQLSIGSFSIDGSPFSRYQDIVADPLGYVISMVPEVGKGHAVTPYAADSTIIYIYDNNDPCTSYDNIDNPAIPGDDRDVCLRRSIQVSSDPDKYVFPRPGKTDSPWEGTGMFTIPISVWQNDIHAPLFDTAGLLTSLVFGEADGHYTTPDGGEWGWRPDGTFVDSMPGAVALVPQTLETDPVTRNVALAIPPERGSPTVQINGQGGDYYFHAGFGHCLFQLQGIGTTPGVTDEVGLGYDSGDLASLVFTPADSGRSYIPKIGMSLGEQASALFRFIGLETKGASPVEFKAALNDTGVEFKNNTGEMSSHLLLFDGVDGEEQMTALTLFGPFEVPDGATHGTSISDWPDSRHVLSEMDLNSDGTPETSEILEGEQPVVAFQCVDAKMLGDGTLVSLSFKIACSGENDFDGFFYIQDRDHTSGIRVAATAPQMAGLQRGSNVQVIGTMATTGSGERQVQALLVLTDPAEDPAKPYIVTGRSIGGGPVGIPPFGQHGIFNGSGANNVGQLVRISAKWTALDGNIMTLDDGSGRYMFVETDQPPSPNLLNTQVIVTGPLSLVSFDVARYPLILARDQDDVETL